MTVNVKNDDSECDEDECDENECDEDDIESEESNIVPTDQKLFENQSWF